MRAFVGLGSNLGDGPATIRAAVTAMDLHHAIQVVRTSGLFRTAPWGRKNQPDFINAVAELETGLGAKRLLTALLGVEENLGRIRDGVRWGPRTIDIDLLCYGQRVSRRPDLLLPHPRMHLRAFVLVPLLELEPDFVIPGQGPARVCLDKLDNQRVKCLA